MHTTQRTIFALLLAGALAGCGQDDANPTDASDPSPSPVQTPTPSADANAPPPT